MWIHLFWILVFVFGGSLSVVEFIQARKDKKLWWMALEGVFVLLCALNVLAHTLAIAISMPPLFYSMNLFWNIVVSAVCIFFSAALFVKYETKWTSINMKGLGVLSLIALYLIWTGQF